MTPKAAGVLIFLAVFGIVASNKTGEVDCRKNPFAPVCRGAVIKRALSSLRHIDPAALLNKDSDRQFVGALRAALDMLEDVEDNHRRISENKQNKLDNFEKMFQQEETNQLLRFLSGNKRGNSERDNFAAQDFENF